MLISSCSRRLLMVIVQDPTQPLTKLHGLRASRFRGPTDQQEMMLGDPKPTVAPLFGMGRKIARIIERAACVGILRDADQIEYRKRCHGETPDRPSSRDEDGQ